MQILPQNIIDSITPSEDIKRLYLDVSKLINDNYYRLINIPDVSAKRSSFELALLDNLSAGPIKTPFGYEVGSGQFTINWMINSFGTTPFEFADWHDIIEVAEILTAYLDKMSGQLKHQPGTFTDDEKVYLSRAANFSVEISKIANKMKLYYHVDTKGTSLFDQHKKVKFEEILKGTDMKETKSAPIVPKVVTNTKRF